MRSSNTSERENLPATPIMRRGPHEIPEHPSARRKSLDSLVDRYAPYDEEQRAHKGTDDVENAGGDGQDLTEVPSTVAPTQSPGKPEL